MKSIGIYFLFIILMSGCAAKKIIDNNKIKDLVGLQKFMIDSYTAQPMATVGMSKLQSSGLLGVGNSSGNISLIGNNNFLKIIGDSISSYLPYFGERRLSAGYGRDNGAIEFEGEIKNYNVEWNVEKQYYSISFQAKNNNELFDVIMNLYPSLKSYITISSTSRTSITYLGNVYGIDNEEL